jgi:hypothetical protein
MKLTISLLYHFTLLASIWCLIFWCDVKLCRYFVLNSHLSQWNCGAIPHSFFITNKWVNVSERERVSIKKIIHYLSRRFYNLEFNSDEKYLFLVSPPTILGFVKLATLSTLVKIWFGIFLRLYVRKCGSRRRSRDGLLLAH